MKKILLLIFVFVEACIVREFVDACFATSQHHVHVLSNLPQDSAPLRIHCSSKNDDLGYHNLFPTQEFQWTFCPDFIPNTLYFCHLWWFPKEKAFDVYKEGINKERPTHDSWWIAKSDGIYFSNQTTVTSSMKKYDWS